MIAGPHVVRLYSLLLFLIAINICRASYVTHPNINFDPVGKLGISGSYNGISLYKDTEQLTQIPKSTSSIVSLSNDTLKLIASSNVNGTIYDACILSNKVFIAGNFSTIKGQSVNNIASIDLTNNQIKSLKYGLDGPVYSIYCDTINQQLYAGGSFIAPVDISMISYSDSLSQFGGGVAIWKDDSQWIGLPWKGVNGPVYSIIKPNNNSILFAGQFNASTDGQPYHAPATQPISLSSTDVTATNTASNSATPGSIICADATNANPWILSDGVKGTWQTTFLEYSVNPVLIRISNSKMENHQTNQFSIRSLVDSTTYQLTYFDPDVNLTKTCSANCSLSKNTNVLYQDFRITNISITNGIAIDINSWYGVSGGLASVKVFQSEIFTYAVDPQSANICASTSSTNSSTPLPKISSVGGWTSSNTSVPYLTLDVTESDLSSPPSVTFYPNLAESGLYEVLLYSPECTTTNCSGRADVDVTILTSASQSSNVTVAPSTATSQSIFSGYFDVSSNFTPSIEIALAKNTSFSGNSTMTIVAHAVQFIKNPSVDVLYSTIQYNITQSAVTATSIPWGKLADNVPSQSIVNSMDLFNGDIYIGGNFTGTDKSNGKYSNIVKYDTSVGQLKALENEGFNGIVQSLVCTDTEIYVGGSFSKLSGTSANVDNLANVARYNIQKGTWSALNGGVDGPILAMNWAKDKQSIIVSGEITQLLKTSNDTFSNSISGTANWNTQNNQWTTTSTDIPYLSGVVYSIISYNSNDYYMGNLKSAQRYQSNGISFITSNSLLSPFDSFSPDGSSNASISVGVLYNKDSVTSNLAKRDVSASDNTTATIFGGQFSLPGNIQNVAIYDNGAWSGVQGADWQGTINTMAVNNDLLYVGGRFSGSTSNNLAVFDLNSKLLSLGPELLNSDGSPATVNIIRHISTQNAMVIGGKFTSIDSMSCSSICSINIKSLQWSTLGSGLVGEVNDVQLINQKLVAAGNLSLNNSPLTIAEYDFDKNTWGPFGTANLPGPSSSLSYDNITQHVYVSGYMNGNSAATYIRVWDGQQFITPKNELGSGSTISSLSMLPVSTTNASSQNVLLVSGFINLGTLGNVSAAFFDGDNWTPYLVTSDANGDTNSGLNEIFYLEQIPFIAPSKTPTGNMPTPLVILVSIAISLGLVFLIVLCSMVFVYIKRKRDTKINPQSSPGAYYGKPPRTPESLLVALKAASPDDEKYEKDDSGIEKPRHLQPENQQLYNMSRSISQEHLHEQSLTPFNPKPVGGVAAMTTARAAPVPPTAHSRSFSQQQQQYNNMFGNTTAVDYYNAPSSGNGMTNTSNGISNTSNGISNTSNGISNTSNGISNTSNGVSNTSNGISNTSNGMSTGAAISAAGAGIAAANVAHTVSHDAARPESYARPYSEIQRDSNNGSFYNNEYTNAREMSEIPSRHSPFNPFRNSEIGAAVVGGGAIAAAGAIASNNKNNINNTSRGISDSERQQPQALSYSNIAPPETSSMAVTPTPETVRWTTASPAAAAIGSAAVKPISLVGTSDGSSSLIDPVYGPGAANKADKVRWINSPSSQDALATAVVTTMPSLANHSSENDSVSTNQNSNFLSPHATPLSNSSTNSFNAPASDVRWTNYNTDEAIGVATIEPVSVEANDYHPSGKLSALSNPSISNTIQSGEAFSSDPDIVRWTTAPSANKSIATATVGPVEPSETNANSNAFNSVGRSQPYKASLSSLAYPYGVDASSENTSRDMKAVGLGGISNSAFASTSSHMKNDSTSSADRVINTNAFRLSDAGSLAPIDTSNIGYSFNNDMNHQDTMSPDSAVRWKTANIGSPIETVYAPQILEPASVMVTRRSANDEENNIALENYYNPQPSQQSPPVKKINKYKPVVNESHQTSAFAFTSTDNTEMNEPIGRKSEAIEDVIASRDLNALSLLIDEETPKAQPQPQPQPQPQSQSQQEQEHQEPVPQLLPVPTPSRSTHSLSGVNAIDGRASSKRMVEEYLTSKKTPNTEDNNNKKFKYKSDFTSLMEEAMKNNSNSDVATEDKPLLYYAKFDFSAREHGELGYEKADPIIVIDSSDDIWWTGYKVDKSDGSFIRGVFPSNYVEIALSIR